MRYRFTEPLEPRRLLAGDVLFIRGADRSGGFLEATNDTQRTEQLADINNASTAGGNHGWKQLADLLRANGYTVTQAIEPLESGAPGTGQTTGAPLQLENLNLAQYDAVVFASNNAVYSNISIDALETYIRNGGGAIFISDGNFGSDWRDAPNSDTQFLSRFGLSVNQDDGTYSLRRDQGDFVEANHPLLIGVDEFDGEGVSPIVVPTTPPAGVTIRRIVGARGSTVVNNGTNPANDFRGTSRAVGPQDAALVTATVGRGRILAHFDRNTFFNNNGAGTDITRFDNQQYALNVFDWATDSQQPWVSSSSFTQADPYVLQFRMEDNLDGSLTREKIRLRDRKTGANLPGSFWSLSLNEGNGFTDVTITIRPHSPLGPYQLRVERRQISDESGNVRSGAIRYAFTLLDLNTPGSVVQARGQANPVPDIAKIDRDWTMSIFADSPNITT
jgi:hypothetical protein